MFKSCLFCEKEFKTKKSHFHRRKYCSWQCVKLAKGGKYVDCGYCNKKIWKYGRDIRRKSKHYFCNTKCKGKFFKGIRVSLKTEFKGKFGNWRKTPKGIHNSPKTEFKKGNKPWNYGTANPRARFNIKERKWQIAVFKRDNWVCQFCDCKGGKLSPHHLFRFKHFPKFRYKISNGITLCRKCHLKVTGGFERNWKLTLFSGQK